MEASPERIASSPLFISRANREKTLGPDDALTTAIREELQRSRETVNFGPIPLVLGVVGHRDLPEDTTELRRVVRELLLGFRERYSATRIVVLSALAEGADRLVAGEALELGLCLVVPLPMEREEYEKDFATEESLADFRAFLQRADSYFIVPPVGSTANGDARVIAYANCGAYIAGRCEELIALWDGEDSPIGGTAEIVRFKLEGIPAPYLPEHEAFDPSRCGPVLHVMVPRGSRPDDERAVCVTPLYPRSAVSDSAAAFEAAKYELDRFNRDVTRGPLAERIKSRTVRQQASALADAYQQRTTKSLLAITAAVFLAVVAFNLYTTFPDHPLALLVAYLVFGAAAFVPYALSRRGEWQLRYQDYRALEQMLRTQEYWRTAGINRSVASRFAESERATIDWITVALRALTEPSQGSPAPGHPVSQRELRVVYEEWIVGQRRYFTEFAGKRERVRERISSLIVTASLVLSVALTVGSHIGSSSGAFKDWVGALLFAATLLAVGAALIHNFAEKRGWTEQSRHYELMGAVFGHAAERIAPLLAEERLDSAMTGRIRAILIALGDEAIRETVAWLNLHRSRPLSVPQV
jgi:hypothetical protein